MHDLINRKTGAALLSVLVCGTLAWLLLGTPSSGLNEADIFLVYARNFLEGHGFVYNIGSEQLEGFPSLLWMLICAFFYMMSHQVEVPLFLLNLLLGSVTVYLCLKRCNQKPTFLILLCSAPAWFVWCQLSLAESGLWCLLLTATILAVSERNTSQSAWLLPLMAMARPEAMLWGCWLILILFVGLGVDRGWRVGLRAIFRPLFTFGIIWAGLVLFRGFYFGSLTPGSTGTIAFPGMQFSAGAGILYFLGYLFSNPAVWLVVLVFVWACIREIRRKSAFSRVSAVCICLLPGLGIPLMVEYEQFSAFRLYQPIWPLLCLVSAWAMPLLYDRQSRLFRRLAPVALLLTGWVSFGLTSNMKHEFSMAQKGREHGSVLTSMFESHNPWPSIGTMTAGGCKYVYPGMVYDLKGLYRSKREDTENRPPFYHEMIMDERYPDILVRNEADPFDRTVFRDLQSDPQFRERYIKGELWYNDEIFFAYYSRRFLSGLEEGHYAFVQDLQHALSMEGWEEFPAAFPKDTLAADIAGGEASRTSPL